MLARTLASSLHYRKMAVTIPDIPFSSLKGRENLTPLLDRTGLDWQNPDRIDEHQIIAEVLEPRGAEDFLPCVSVRPRFTN